MTFIKQFYQKGKFFDNSYMVSFFLPPTEMEYVWGVNKIFLEQKKNFKPLIAK